MSYPTRGEGFVNMDTFWFEVLLTVWILSKDQIELFNNYSYSIEIYANASEDSCGVGVNTLGFDIVVSEFEF